jgi:acetyl esterase/lipase
VNNTSRVDAELAAFFRNAGQELANHPPVRMDETLPVMVHFHGGGFLQSSIDTHNRLSLVPAAMASRWSR